MKQNAQCNSFNSTKLQGAKCSANSKEQFHKHILTVAITKVTFSLTGTVLVMAIRKYAQFLSIYRLKTTKEPNMPLFYATSSRTRMKTRIISYEILHLCV